MALASFSTLPMRPQNRRPFFPSKLAIKSPLNLHHNNSTPSLHALPTILISSASNPPLNRQSSNMSLNNATGYTETPDLNTLPDPRSPTPQISRQSSVTSEHHPDLSNEVAALSTKLVNALNYQTDLDDNLQSTRQELDAARERVAQLEQQSKEYQDQLSQGLLVKRADSVKAQEELKNEIEQERIKRSSAEQAKKGMEQELEALTGQLFEEANSMVASARKEKEESEQKNEQLKLQLNEAEMLLASHQAQLHELKKVLHSLQPDKSSKEEGHSGTTPSTPIISIDEKGLGDALESPRIVPESTLVPGHPLHFSNLVQPVMRTDIQAYEDFIGMLRSNVNISSTPSSRVHSGNFGGLNVMGLTGISQSSAKTTTNTAPNVSSLTTSSPKHPAPGSFNPTTPPDQSNPSTSKDTSLKDSKFYKRAVTEDIEPTLRLDLAPGLSWLARRTVLNSMASGSLMVDPFPVGSRYYSPAFPCALCGEYRKQPLYLRTHRFRTSDSDDAQRYPVCDFCLDRLRATADFIGFLRNVKNGHWKAECEEDEHAAWQECTKLRERMFWARLGGGVIPVVSFISSETTQTPKSTHVSESVDLSEQIEDEAGTSPEEQHSRPITLGSPVSRRPKSGLLRSEGSQDLVGVPLSQIEVQDVPEVQSGANKISQLATLDERQSNRPTTAPNAMINDETLES